MKTILTILLFLAGFSLSGRGLGDELMTPDGYLGHPAFEFGMNGDSDSYTYENTYSYTDYANAGENLGKSDFNYNRFFLNVYFPVSPTLTLACGGSYLFNASGSSTTAGTANNFTGTENGVTNYSYTGTLAWFVSMKVYTK